MFCFPDIDFSELCYADDLKVVGIESTADLIKPAIILLLKDGIQKHIASCNLSKEACEELIRAYSDEGIDIILDENIHPDIATLPTSFSDTSEKAADDTEHRRALNYASWVIENLEISDAIRTTDGGLSKAGTAYPFNLLNDIYHKGEISFHSLELCDLLCDALNDALGMLQPAEEKIIRAIYQRGIPTDDIIHILACENNVVISWALTESITRIRRKALRKLRHPSFSKEFRQKFSHLHLYDSRLNAFGATLDDMRNSFLCETSFGNHGDDINFIIWSEERKSPCFQRILDVTKFPANLVYHSYDLGWCSWPSNLMRGTALSAFFAGHTAELVCTTYDFCVNPNLGPYLMATGFFDDGKVSHELFKLINGALHRVDVDPSVLCNLCDIICNCAPEPTNPKHFRVLYTAEAQYCRQRQQEVSDPKEWDFYSLYLELITERLNNLPSTKASLDCPIEELDLSVRSFNCLKRANILTVADIVSKTEDELTEVRNLRRKEVDEIISKLNELGLKLKGSL